MIERYVLLVNMSQYDFKYRNQHQFNIYNIPFLNMVAYDIMKVLASGEDRFGYDPLSYFMDKIIQRYNEYEPIKISDDIFFEITSIINKDKDRLKNNIRDAIGENYSDIVNEIDQNSINELKDMNPIGYLRKKDPLGVILKLEDNDEIMIISKTTKINNEIINIITGQINELENITKDFGVKIEKYLTNHKYVEHAIKKYSKSEEITLSNSKDDFEKEIITFVKRFTNNIISNCTIKFQDPNEDFEFDILIALSNYHIVNIEVTDYSKSKSKSFAAKQELIIKPFEKVNRIINVEVINIVKGVPNETLSKMKPLVGNRNVTLCNDTEYKEVIEKLFKNSMNYPPKNFSNYKRMRQREMYRRRQIRSNVR